MINQNIEAISSKKRKKHVVLLAPYSFSREKRISKALPSTFFYILWTAAAAAPVAGNDAKVVLCLAPPDQGRLIFNPIREYGNPIRYVRHGEPLYVFVDGTGYTLDLDGAIEEAMAEWTAAVPSLRFQSMTAGLENRTTWKVKVSDADVTRLGSGYRLGIQPSAATPELIFYHKGFWKAAKRFPEYV